MASEISKRVHKDADNIYSDQETIEILDDTHEKDATEEVDSGEVIDFKSDGAEQIYPHGIRLAVIIASLAASVFLVALVREDIDSHIIISS